MSFRTNLLKKVHEIRKIPSTQFDNRPNQLTIRRRVWGGGYIGEGSPVDTDLVIPNYYKIRQVTTAEVLASGGSYELGDIVIDHITPSDGAGVGYTPAQLAPDASSPAEEVIYLITGTLGGEYTRISIERWRTYSYRLNLRRRATTP